MQFCAAGGRQPPSDARPGQRNAAQAKRRLNPARLRVVEIGPGPKALESAFLRLPVVQSELSAGPGFVFLLRREELGA